MQIIKLSSCFLLSFFVLKSSPAYSAVCPINAIEAIQVAEEEGFSFSTTISGTPGSCNFRTDTGTIEAAAGDQTGPITCVVELFKKPNYQLNNLWRIKDAIFKPIRTLLPSSRSRSESASLNQNNIPITIKINIVQGDTITLRLQRITLDGPDCNRWENAFTMPIQLPPAE